MEVNLFGLLEGVFTGVTRFVACGVQLLWTFIVFPLKGPSILAIGYARSKANRIGPNSALLLSLFPLQLAVVAGQVSAGHGDLQYFLNALSELLTSGKFDDSLLLAAVLSLICAGTIDAISLRTQWGKRAL